MLLLALRPCFEVMSHEAFRAAEHVVHFQCATSPAGTFRTKEFTLHSMASRHSLLQRALEEAPN